MARHLYRNPDHIRRRNMPAPDTGAVATHLNDLLSPLVYNQLSYYRQLGLRERILGLPLMLAAVLTLLWRQVPSVYELTRLFTRKDLLWAEAPAWKYSQLQGAAGLGRKRRWFGLTY